MTDPEYIRRKLEKLTKDLRHLQGNPRGMSWTMRELRRWDEALVRAEAEKRREDECGS